MSANLVASHPENGNAMRHGLYSPRHLDERAREIVNALMELPWAQPLDVIGFEEVASVVSALESVDEGLRRTIHWFEQGLAAAEPMLETGSGRR